AEPGAARHPEPGPAPRDTGGKAPQILLRRADFDQAADLRFVREQSSISDQELCKLPGAWFEGAVRLPGHSHRARLEAESVDGGPAPVPARRRRFHSS